ncbi:MAG: hypothetical protein H7329_11155 [Opitutaceae bacterium]|nr:hypothetical protein [Cytophagales bacterium]
MKALVDSLIRNKIPLLLLALVVTLLALHHRRPDALINAQFWMEDGEIFFLESYKYGFLSFFIPYAEYVHVFPRTISIIGHYLVPILYIPLFYNILSLTTFLLTVVYIWFRGPDNKITALLMVFALTLLPVHNEVFMNITNQQWSLALVLLIPLCYKSHSKACSVFDACIVLIIGLTGPFSTIFYPIVVVSYYYMRDEFKEQPHLKFPFYTYTFAAFLQLALILFFPLERSAGKISFLHLVQASSQIFYQQFALLTTIKDFIYVKSSLTIFLGVMFLVIVFISTLLSFRYYLKTKKITPFVFLSAILLMFLSTIYGYRNNPEMVDPISTDRYFYISSVALFWALFYFIENKKYLQYTALTGFALIFFFKAEIIPVKIFRDMHWEKYVQKFEGKEPFEIPINPPDRGWIIKIVPKNN